MRTGGLTPPALLGLHECDAGGAPAPPVCSDASLTSQALSKAPVMSTLKGKTLFITGASRGIGLAIALRAAQDGANIAVVAKTVDPHPRLPGTIHTAVSEIEKAGGRGLA
jgi:hypothetical protein